MSESQKPPQMFVWFESVDGVRVPKMLVPATSKHAAKEALEKGGHTLGFLESAELCDPADLIRLVIPSLVMQLVGLTQLLGVVAQNAQEQMAERATRRGVGLIRGNG